ncbi:small acid-soluble spore protein Tlp [Brevibacillus humidisoli]|nr:small acid-soluble spore protein Tlp [Brevibacillus humidisoli]UFJ43350.1 small acid-soluble spore protein Tlp [Brevibacillus humidisoli]
MAKPDNRADNGEKMQRMIDNTMEHIRESRDYMKAHKQEMPADQLADMQAKNERREESIQSFRAEIEDENSR